MRIQRAVWNIYTDFDQSLLFNNFGHGLRATSLPQHKIEKEGNWAFLYVLKYIKHVSVNTKDHNMLIN